MAREKHVATFLGASPTLIIAGDHCFSYSGNISIPNGVLTTMNSFMTGKYITKLLIEVNGNFSGIAQSQFRLQVSLNGVIIIKTTWDATLDSSMFDFPARVIVPANTDVNVSLYQTEGNPQDMQTIVTGRIYA